MEKKTNFKATVNKAAASVYDVTDAAYRVAEVGLVITGLTSLVAAVVQLATSERTKNETTEK